MSTQRSIAVVTGTRAEFGLLRPVMRAIDQHPSLALRVIATGTHLLAPACTIRDIHAEFTVDCAVPMQREGVTSRASDAEALGRGVTGLASALAMLAPDVVLVPGDRIEALAGALAASIAGIRVAHIHGGDRAEGIADESIRHAITKLAHLHFPATEESRRRIIAMGERDATVHNVGSPAIDDLADVPTMNDADFAALGKPDIIFLMHPDNSLPAELAFVAALTLAQCKANGNTLAMHPNHDAGRDTIMQSIAQAGCAHRAHLPRLQFVALLKRVRALVGNSSAGLIEAAAVGLPVVNVGPRQAQRECAENVVHVPIPTESALHDAVLQALAAGRRAMHHPFGDGRSGQRVAATLATIPFADIPLAKRISY